MAPAEEPPGQDVTRLLEQLRRALRGLPPEAGAEPERLLQELARLALTDPLTGLLNRRAVEDLARREVQRQRRYRRPLALGLLDIDHFREVNRRFLLPGGDRVLAAVAGTLRDALRSVDQVGRFGGDEFLLLAAETDAGGARALGDRLRAAVEDAAVDYHGERIRVSVSIGFATAAVEVAAEYEPLLRAAAEALAEAKAQGRNRCVVYPARS